MPPAPEPVEPTEALGPGTGRCQSFAELYAELAPALLGWATLRMPRSVLRYVGPEDILQEVWCRTAERFATFDPTRASFRSWLFGFAYRVLREALRGAVRLQRSLAADGSRVFSLDDLPEAATSLTRRVARAERTRLFVERLQALDLEAEEKEILLLRGLEGLPHEEVATQLGLTPSATRKRWERLRDRLVQVAGDLQP